MMEHIEHLLLMIESEQHSQNPHYMVENDPS